MSGHSKWSKIRHKKGKADKARSSSFTKLLRAVMVAAQSGGDPDMNFSLRLAVDKAKAGNVPKDNIERAVKKGSGEAREGVVFEEVLYEGFGPGGVAMLVECLTDNKNRAVSDVKYILTKNGGTMAVSGAVQWQFERKGIVRLGIEAKKAMQDWDSLELTLMDKGVQDIKESEFGVEIISAMEDLKKIVDAVIAAGAMPEDSGLEWVAKDTIDIDEGVAAKLESLLEKFEENDDVTEVYTNVA